MTERRRLSFPEHGYVGVQRHFRRWRVRICVGDEQVHLATYDTEWQAGQAVKAFDALPAEWRRRIVEMTPAAARQKLFEKMVKEAGRCQRSC